MKNKENINIVIDGTESNKSEIIYNNVIQNMDLSKEEQVAYLKTKVSLLELEMKNKIWVMLLVIISIAGMSAGIYFMVANIYFLGIIFILGTFLGVVSKLYFMYLTMMKLNRNADYDKIEHLRRMLNMKLK